MTMPVKAKVGGLLAMESHRLREQEIHKIRAAKEAHMYWAEMFSATKRTQFQVHLSRARQAATTWSDADCLKAIDCLECEIHQATPTKCKLFNELFQRHERQL
jgi:hypothetical protein